MVPVVDPLQPADPPSVGRYQLTGRLGVGGMGVVYRAEGRRGAVALKVVRPELAQDLSFRARFRREVQSCFRVSSAFTARLVDFDTEASAPWMATEFVEGEPLDQLVERTGPLGPEAQIALAAGLAESLVAIHAEDVVHRDLKPANVMCTESGPKVIDFGIATAGDALPMTQVGMVIGSPGWITPEQLLTGEASPASDVFAWGCLIAYAASGVQPYGSGQIQTVFWRVLNQPPYIDRARLSPLLCELVDEAVGYEAAGRPDAAQLLDRLLAAARPVRQSPRRPEAVPDAAVQPAPVAAVSVVDEKWALATQVLGGAALPVSLLRTDDSGAAADAVELVKGANTELETAPLLVDLMWSVADGADLEVAALLIGDDGRAYREQPIVDRSRPQGPEEVVHHAGHDRTERGWRDRLLIDLAAAPSRLSRVLVTAALEDRTPASTSGPVTFGAVTGLEVVVGAPRAGGRPVRFVVPPLGSERAVVAVEIYRRGGRWRVRAVAQGYAEGAAGLARDFGAEWGAAAANAPVDV
jgi:stress response protein SCP2/predicted Ser/Thr protein kinase